MLKQIATLCVAMSCIIGTISVHAVMCKTRTTPRVPVSRIIGTSHEVNLVSMFLLSGGVKFVKPLNLQLWLKQLSDAVKGMPLDLHQIVLEYAGISPAGRNERLYSKENPNLAALFEDHISHPARTGCAMIDAAQFQAALERKKKNLSEVDLLYNIVRSMSGLGADYEPSPFEYIIEQRTQSGSCLRCGENVPCGILSRKCDSVYNFSKNSLDIVINQKDASVSVAELLKRVMAIPKTATQMCTCKFPVAVTCRDVFMTTPQLLLLHFDDRPQNQIAIPEFIEVNSEFPMRYELQGVWGHCLCFDGNGFHYIQFKGSDRNWYLTHHSNNESVRHNPINKSGNLVSYGVSTDGEILPLYDLRGIQRAYSKFLLYKKIPPLPPSFGQRVKKKLQNMVLKAQQKK